MANSNIQIHVYSNQKAIQIAEVLKEYSPLVENWTGEDNGSWPIVPQYVVFLLKVPETEITNEQGCAVPKILNAVKDCNATVYVEDERIVVSKTPATVEEHCQWCQLSINEYQHIFPSRKLHIHAEELHCSDCNETWFSLPSSFEKARLECPCCNKVDSTEEKK